MQICIYCLRDSSTSTGVPHVLPEGVVKNALTLPKGVECDSCNAYAGNKLEPNLLRYPKVALAIQFLGAPGKRGKPRAEVGGVRRERIDQGSFRLAVNLQARVTRGADNRVTIDGRLAPDPAFDFLRFRRALHHAALNMVAARQGASAALAPEFDAVRKYVRKPAVASESWPYGEFQHKTMPRVLAGQFVTYDTIEFVALHVLQTVFLVDPRRSGTLAAAVAALGGQFIAPEVSEPPHALITASGTPAA